jgi:hypothetical protein
VVFVITSRKPVEPRRVAAREGALTGVMIDPVALFERSFEVADAYEKWLEAQAELFWALNLYSTASLGLFRSLLGKRPAARAGAPRHDSRALSGSRKRRRMH